MSAAEVLDREYRVESLSIQNNVQTETFERVVCYVCGGNGAGWTLSTKANEKDKLPYFPFLESIEKAEGAKAIKENGRIDACAVCFSFLLQQWRSYEEMRTPVDKRSYWLKRSGGGTIEFNNYRDHSFDVKHVRAPRIVTSFEKKQNTTGVCKSVKYGEKGDQKLFMSNISDSEEGDETVPQRGDLASVATSSATHNHVMSDIEIATGHLKEPDTCTSSENRPNESCFICGCQKASGMKTIHTKPQLKTETPFFPALAQYNSPSRAKKADFTGKVTVCEDCHLFLLNQWHDFESRGTPLSERQYYIQLQNTKGPQQQLSHNMTCFICGEKYPNRSGCNVSTKKTKPGNPYFPFLSSILPCNGAAPSTQEGLVRVCDPCYQSLIQQWNIFESRHTAEFEREYCVGNRMKKKSKDLVPKSKEVTPDTVTCSICKVQYHSHNLSLNTSHATSVNKEHDLSKNFVCCLCMENLPEYSNTGNAKSFVVEHKQPNTSAQCREQSIKSVSRSKPHLVSASHDAALKWEVCFLCGEKVKSENSSCLCVLPRQDFRGNQPFFPSLAYTVPSYHAKPLSSSGTVIVCDYCHGNMMNQWWTFEKTDKNGISNPWSRQYFFTQFICYLCGKVCPRHKITSISAGEYTFLNKVRRPARAFKINDDKNYVVCLHCQEIVIVQKENFDKCGVGLHVREYELPMVTSDSNTNGASKTLGRKTSDSHLSIVIGDSESEGDDRDIQSEQEESRSTPVVDCKSINVIATTGSKQAASKTYPKESFMQSVSMSSPAAQNSSFAAALRKLAKQAMSPGSQSPVAISPSTNQLVSPVNTKDCDSLKHNGGPASFKKETSDPSFLSSKENRSHANKPSTPELTSVCTTSMGHQIVPGVFSLGPRGFESKSNPLQENPSLQDVPRVHPHAPSHSYYMPFLQRPPLADSVYMPSFHYYPPPMVDAPGFVPPGFDHETWRKRRALEHLRQQHERHTHYYAPRDRPLYIMEQDSHKPLPAQTTLAPRSHSNENSPRPDSSVTSDLRSANSSLPKEAEKVTEFVSSRPPSYLPEHTAAPSSVPRHSHSTAPAIITSANSAGNQLLRSSSRDSVNGERESDVDAGRDVKQREHQIMWTRKMFEQKRRLRQEEIEWQHRQQQVRQQKREVQQELYHFRQKLLQQKEAEQDDSSKKEHEKQLEKDESDKKWQVNNEKAKDSTIEEQRMNVDKMVFPHYGYSLYQDQPGAVPQSQSLPAVYRPPGLQQHEMFYPPGYLHQAPLPPKMDTRMYREYLQQPSHFLDNKAVSEWLEKQRNSDFPADSYLSEGLKNSVDRFGPVGMVLNGKIKKDGEKYPHEPQKLKFMKDLGLMTVSEKKERVQVVFGGEKMKLSTEVNSVDDEVESNKENRMENGERPVDVKNGVDQENDNEAYCKKVEFLFNLGLVTHHKRKELEDDFEKNRWERRTQRFQRRTKKTKKEKKEEKERNRSRTPLDLDVSGPITRQKQQLLQEYGLLLPIKDSSDKDSSSSPDSTKTSTVNEQKENQGGPAKKPRKEDYEAPALKDNSEKTFRHTYEVSTPPPQSTSSTTVMSSGPQLTLQSITHMDNPYRAFPSAFHSPFYHSGLLSIRQNPAIEGERTLLKKKPSFAVGDAMKQEPSRCQSPWREKPSTRLPPHDVPKWPGTSKIIQSYVTYHKEQEIERNESKETSETLRTENSWLNEESAQLNLRYSELIESKRRLRENHDFLNEKLKKLHNFLTFVQNS